MSPKAWRSQGPPRKQKASPSPPEISLLIRGAPSALELGGNAATPVVLEAAHAAVESQRKRLRTSVADGRVDIATGLGLRDRADARLGRVLRQRLLAEAVGVWGALAVSSLAGCDVGEVEMAKGTVRTLIGGLTAATGRVEGHREPGLSAFARDVLRTRSKREVRALGDLADWAQYAWAECSGEVHQLPAEMPDHDDLDIPGVELLERVWPSLVAAQSSPHTAKKLGTRESILGVFHANLHRL